MLVKIINDVFIENELKTKGDVVNVNFMFSKELISSGKAIPFVDVSVVAEIKEEFVVENKENALVKKTTKRLK
jgi:hypothetical protein